MQLRSARQKGLLRFFLFRGNLDRFLRKLDRVVLLLLGWGQLDLVIIAVGVNLLVVLSDGVLGVILLSGKLRLLVGFRHGDVCLIF